MPLTGFKADLHIHTVLSPCGDLEMSPTAIVDRALERGLDMIAISDHNTTRQVKVAELPTGVPSVRARKRNGRVPSGARRTMQAALEVK